MDECEPLMITKSLIPSPWRAWILVTSLKFSTVWIGLSRSPTHLSRNLNTVAVCFTNLGSLIWSSRGRCPPMWLKWGRQGGCVTNILSRRSSMNNEIRIIIHVDVHPKSRAVCLSMGTCVKSVAESYSFIRSLIICSGWRYHKRVGDCQRVLLTLYMFLFLWKYFLMILQFVECWTMHLKRSRILSECPGVSDGSDVCWWERMQLHHHVSVHLQSARDQKHFKGWQKYASLNPFMQSFKKQLSVSL